MLRQLSESFRFKKLLLVVKNMLRQLSESFRFKKLLLVSKRNGSDWQKYVSLGFGIYLDVENALGSV